MAALGFLHLCFWSRFNIIYVLLGVCWHLHSTNNNSIGRDRCKVIPFTHQGQHGIHTKPSFFLSVSGLKLQVKPWAHGNVCVAI